MSTWLTSFALCGFQSWWFSISFVLVSSVWNLLTISYLLLHWLETISSSCCWKMSVISSFKFALIHNSLFMQWRCSSKCSAMMTNCVNHQTHLWHIALKCMPRFRFRNHPWILPHLLISTWRTWTFINCMTVIIQYHTAQGVLYCSTVVSGCVPDMFYCVNIPLNATNIAGEHLNVYIYKHFDHHLLYCRLIWTFLLRGGL